MGLADVPRRAAGLGSIVAAVGAGSLLHPLVTGQTGSWTLGGSTHTVGGNTVVPALALVAVAVALGLVWIDAISVEDVLPDRESTRSVASVALAALVVTTTVIGAAGVGMTGTGSAETTIDPARCTIEDVLLGGVINAINPEDSCGYYRSETRENVTQTDAYSAGLTMKASSEAFLSQTENSYQMANSTAWLEAMVAIRNAYEDNATRSEAIERADNASDDVFAAVERNVLASYSTHSRTLRYWGNTSSTMYFNMESGGITGSSTDFIVTLSNGTNVTATAFHASGGSYYIVPLQSSDPRLGPENTTTSAGEFNVGGDPHTAFIENANGTAVGALDVQDYNDALDRVKNGEQRIDSNIGQFVNETYDKFQNGTLDPDNLTAASPTALAYDASTDADSTGYYAYSNAALAAVSADGDVNVSHIVRTTDVKFYVDNGTKVYDNRTVDIEGTLFYTGDENFNLTTGETYNPDNYSGSFVMTVATMSNNSTGNTVTYNESYFTIEENFTILSATNTNTGESLNKTRIVERDYATTNTSLYEQKMEDAEATREYYNSIQQPTSGGGSTGGSGSNSIPLLGAIAGALGISVGLAALIVFLGLILVLRLTQ
jgi:hypothetical protein